MSCLETVIIRFFKHPFLILLKQLLFCRMLLSAAWESCMVFFSPWSQEDWWISHTVDIAWIASQWCDLCQTGSVCCLWNMPFKTSNSVVVGFTVANNLTRNWTSNFQSWTDPCISFHLFLNLTRLSNLIVEKHICRWCSSADHVKSNRDGPLMSLCTINTHVWLCEQILN